jgi:hypothetical protein
MEICFRMIYSCEFLYIVGNDNENGCIFFMCFAVFLNTCFWNNDKLVIERIDR